MASFTHLHVHSQYSILDGAASVNKLVTRAKEYGMSALALTDHGTMFGIKEFHATCKRNGIKPLLGVETYFVNDIEAMITNSRGNITKDNRNWHLILIAKNPKGYQNLLKLVSKANTEGVYYKPRIDRKWLEEHHDGLIVSSACLGGEIPQLIMKNKLQEAEDAAHWYKNIFGDDFYLELMYHPAASEKERLGVSVFQQEVNNEMIKLAKKTDIKLIATNDVHFADAEDADAHDVLICLNTGKDMDDPNRMRYTRQEWLKSPEEMEQLWGHIPEALTNTMEIADKVEEFELDHAPIMPVFPIPEEFGTEDDYRSKYTPEALIEEFGEERFNILGGYDKIVRIKFEADYLEHLTYEGAKQRYGDKFEEYKERIDFELNTIKTMGFPGYFLITQDFINEAKQMGVLVGPGRGSAAGAVVSYSVGITNIDPIKYDLLFERFLNPDRISMPDVDIDFDDDGRQQVLDWVTDKYGIDKVAHICTFGTMATKSAIKDVARVLRLPLEESNRLAKMVPEAPKMNFKKAYAQAPELLKEKDSQNPLIVKTLQLAESLEGSIRQTGVHACGILIGRDPLSENIPLIPTKEEKLFTTQYDGRYVEDIGLLKMDFLGLKTLSIIKETLENIKRSRGIILDIDTIPGDDALTFELFSKGDTTAIFQFESPGMKKHLRNLKPNRFEDLVAMNALYRPGPMEYIPDYIDRKHGRKQVEYDHPMMEKYLDDTYGITVFQEQVMLLSRHLANFTRGESDTLRKAMGKKKMDLMEKLKAKFTDGCKSNEKFMEGCKGDTKLAVKLIDKIWKDWEAFASYAFNKSHSVCYAHIAYQTGYLKAHYPAEFMAGVLSRNLSDITKISIFMEECRRMGMDVKGPDANESLHKFAVNKDGDIRFAMAGIKGMGSGASEDIIKEREENGPYNDLYDFAERVNLTSCTKKNWEALALSGGFDSMGTFFRSQLFASLPNEETTFIENMIRYGNRYQQDKASLQNSLFGMMSDSEVEIKKPEMPQCMEWSNLHQLAQEKELIGIYLSAHPLDQYRLEIKNFFNTRLPELDNLDELQGREVTTGGMVTAVRHSTTKRGNPYGILTLEDYSGPFEFAFFGSDYITFKNYFQEGLSLLVKGRVQARKYGNGDLEFKIASISLLNDARENLLKKITLEMDLNTVSLPLVDQLNATLAEHTGETLLSFKIINKEHRQALTFHSRALRVNVDDELIKYLEMLPNISYKIN